MATRLEDGQLVECIIGVPPDVCQWQETMAKSAKV
jgi:hypothetical protein